LVVAVKESLMPVTIAVAVNDDLDSWMMMMVMMVMMMMTTICSVPFTYAVAKNSGALKQSINE